MNDRSCLGLGVHVWIFKRFILVKDYTQQTLEETMEEEWFSYTIFKETANFWWASKKLENKKHQKIGKTFKLQEEHAPFFTDYVEFRQYCRKSLLLRTSA